VVKNRYGGHLGLVPLKFHSDSLTLSNCFRQNKKDVAMNSKSEKLSDDNSKSNNVTKLEQMSTNTIL